MVSSHSLTPAPRNRLLAALPPSSLSRIWPELRPVELVSKVVLHEPNAPITSIYFPDDGYVSMVAYMEDGDAAEVGLVGPEGLVGLPVLLGSDRSTIEALVQCPGTAWTMSADALRAAVSADPVLHSFTLRYALAHLEQVARTAACNSRHHTQERLARWLLMAHDRTSNNQFPMTHEILSMMLGVRRAGITVAAGQFQKSGFIRYEKGRITVTDRAGLESVACECYGVQRRIHEHLFCSRAAPGSEQS
ncbi:Crp/Fnr family transcriptional regulator [Teichococcus vastitatis]|uniref:Crp/Fnr family transcriptional regulator n=1 Tax=Teichococcus vastitatis TaxID=2307076 RepID=A0ABS9WC02_9PROT|nr:Crp/Fnr family transcriptional regulator [Pseudoroseomonas vastitatis]MCI0756831.1 Crp/Fnr family transcriptional regulator [Pseudoroseomonas vastitatis]